MNKLLVESEGGQTILQVQGVFTYNIEGYRALSHSLKGVDNLVIELNKATHIDSSALGLLL